VQKKSSSKAVDEPVSSQMQIKKRNGSLEPVDLNKIVRAIGRCCNGLPNVDPIRVASKTISGIFNGATTQQLDELSIQTAAALISEEPEYSKLAANLMAEYIRKEVANQEIHSFSHAMTVGHEQGLINDRLLEFVKINARKLNNAIKEEHSELFEYFGIRTVYDRYLLRHPVSRKVIETPQYFMMRVAAALAMTVADALETYRLISNMNYIPSTPTLFNAGTTHEQMSSCYLMAPPEDSIEGIYEIYGEIAFNSKFAGGIGSPWGTIRSADSLIKGTNGKSNGILPWLKTLDSSVAAVNQGGRRKGAAAVYLPTWHADIEDFLELRNNTLDANKATRNLNLAHWVPDLFMDAVDQDRDWYLFDPKDVPDFNESFGIDFDNAYSDAVTAGKFKKKVKARDLYAKMMLTLAETGNGWMCWSDRSNVKSNQTGMGDVIHSSNLCTEILEVTKRKDSDTETAVCNLASVVLPSYWDRIKGSFDYKTMVKDIKQIVRQLDRVIDLNFYPIVSAEVSNKKWRPIGLGVMGLQDVFFLAGLPFDSPEAVSLSTKIQEEIYYAAMSASCDLAEKEGSFPNFSKTRTALGKLQFDLWDVVPADKARWDALKDRIASTGLRNSLVIAIAPTATIGSIIGVYECIEPQVSNLFKRETLSGEFIQLNRYLVADLKKINLWNEDIRSKIKIADGSIAGIEEIPVNLRLLYRTVWELSQKDLIDMAAARGPYIDQSQSLNLFIENPTVGKLSSMYMYAWKKGLKTTYYLRSRGASSIAKTTVTSAPTTSAFPPAMREVKTDPALQHLLDAAAMGAAIACSLENPESCEACQ
jgi:ribonucleoside-diphosphate reductase alpha chain